MNKLSFIILWVGVFAGHSSYAQFSTNNGNTYVINGSVGIGTANPIEYSGGPRKTLHLFNASGESIFRVQSQTVDFEMGTSPNTNSFFMSTRSAHDFAYFSGSVERFRVTKDGNFGLGTGSPSGKLHIDGPLDGSIAALTIGSGNTGNLNVPLGRSPGGYNIDFKTWRDIVPDQVGARIRAERINNHLGGNALIQSMDLVFLTSYGGDQSQLTEKLRIKSDGNIGIGTPSPDAKLTVNGTIHSREVKVDTSIPVPDYVFNKNYPLMPLTDVEKYISVNKHLPEIPSAKETEKEGINLSEMSLKLLKKVEELTLYLIEKEKKDKDQEAKLKAQQDQLNDLHQKLNNLLSKHNEPTPD